MTAKRFLGCTGCLALFLVVGETAFAQKPKPTFELAPAVAVEAEEFRIESGWKVVANGQGNYMVDIIGFCHISGERLLCADEKDRSASAFKDIQVPVAGNYRLWVRYEYPAFCEARFRVIVEQEKKAVIDQVLGTRDNPRYAYGNPRPMAQHDPSWGPEGLMEEAVAVPGLKAGPARIYLKAIDQPQTPGVAAGRHIDLVYLTSDTADAWMKHHAQRTNLYPILDAFRDTRGPRYEVRFTNRGPKPASFSVNHTYNRLPWYVGEGVVAKEVQPGASTEWIGLKLQDTCHYHLAAFAGTGQPFDLSIRAAGGAVEREATGAASYAFYLPPYPGMGEKPVTPVEQIDAVLKQLAAAPAIGKKPIQPWCYGGWMPLGQDSDVGRKYAQLYAAIGMRSLHPANSGPAQLQNLAAAGVPPTPSWMVMSYRNPPTAANIEQARKALAKSGMEKHLRWYDYGDEIGFSEWMGLRVQGELARARAAGQKTTAAEVTARSWQEWLKAKRPGFQPRDYWLSKWGEFDAARLRPDSSAEAAAANPRLYVDSLIFYEDAAIEFVAAGARAVKAALGAHVWCGANYSCHPFYYPTSTMYIKWFRGQAADMGRHSEYFWQVAQAGPMINGYIAEHFRSGLRDNPRGVIRQYTMPHAPGNTDANFLRTAFSHLAHGARMLDFFGIGMNESFTENHIDHRAASRYLAIRDVTHAIGLVEDLLPESSVVASPVALLISESTERWDFAGIATDHAGHAHFGPNFRKTRLNSHLERLGLWKALTFRGVSPDLVIEEDLKPQLLKNYRVLVMVGDCLPTRATAALEQWVKEGGVLLATAGSGRFGSYREPNPAVQELLGLKGRRTEERETFFRPRQELPFLKPLARVRFAEMEMPQLGTFERIEPIKDAEVLARFADDGSPALVARSLGKGRVFYVAALPGVAYLWSAMQPPLVPDRGPNTHSIPTAFDPAARALLETVLKAAQVETTVECGHDPAALPPLKDGTSQTLLVPPVLVDARLLRAPKGWILPIANYHATPGQKVKLSIRANGKVSKVTSAYHGVLTFVAARDRIEVTIPSLGYGDILRLDP